MGIPLETGQIVGLRETCTRQGIPKIKPTQLRSLIITDK